MERKLLGKRIKEVRNERKLTGEKLAELCHIDATYLRQVESGTKTPSLPVFTDICNALRVSPAYLLKDSLLRNEYEQLKELSDLWEQASAGQMELVAAIIKTALEHTGA